MSAWPDCSRRRVTDAINSIKTQAPTAKFVGEFAVKFVTGEIGKRISRATNAPTQPATSQTSPSPSVAPHEPSMTHSESISEIPDYDIMGARELVTRLNAVSIDTVRLVRDREKSGRNRATVISACDLIIDAR
jgi:hypothetical protein